jgi:Putative zinc-finger
MDHTYIQEHQIVSQYAVGKLDPADRVQFEDHLVDCPQCLDELELTDDFRHSLRNVESLRENPIESRPANAGRLVAILAAAAVVVIGLVSFIFMRENRGIERQLDQARTDASTWERRYNDEHQARTNAESQLRESPVASALLFTLNLTRSANVNTDAPSNAISIPREAKVIVLSLELQNDPDFQSYRATLIDAAGSSVWTADGINPSTSGALALILPASVIRPGKYILTIDGRHGQQYSVAGSYSFLATQQK